MSRHTANGNTTVVTKPKPFKEDINKDKKSVNNSEKARMTSNGEVINTESCKNDKDEIDKVDSVEHDIISGQEGSDDPIAEESADTVDETPVASASAVFVPKYIYTDKQCSSLNMSGKKCDIGIKEMKDDPSLKNKPNEPLIEAFDVNKMAHTQVSFNAFRLSRPDNNTIYPTVLKGGYDGLRNDTPGDLNKDGRNLAVAGKGCVELGQTSGANSSHGPDIHVTSREDVKLKQEDSTWTPTGLVRENLSEEELRARELYKKFSGILNKLTPQKKFDTLVKNVIELEIDSQKEMECVIDLLFEKALTMPNFSEAYANICLKLSQLRVPSDNNRRCEVSFRGLIISKCQTEFETGKLNEQIMQLEKELAETVEPAKKKELQIMINNEKRKIRLRAVANIRFIGELYKLKMLTDKIMHYCMRNLIDHLEEDNLECLCELLVTIGEKAENEGKTEMDSIFNKMQEIVRSKSNKISGRVKTMLQDTIDLRRRKWLVKSIVYSQPKMIDQIPKETKQQQRRMTASMPMSVRPISRPVYDNAFKHRTKVPKGGFGGIRNDAGKASVKLDRTGGSNNSHKLAIHASSSAHDEGEMREEVKLKQVDSACKPKSTSIVLENLPKEELHTQGKHTSNLKNHKSIKHTAEYIELSNRNKENISIQPCLNAEKVKNMCVRLVTTHGRPFAMVDDAAFQEIVNIAVPSNAISKEINSNVITRMIPEKAYQIRSKIGADVRNKMVSLKLDSATYGDRNFLGINLQYIEKGKLTIRQLAVLEVMEKQTGEPLKEKILEVLANFTIGSSQIYSITTDNGCYYFKRMRKLLNEHCWETFHSTIHDIDEESSFDDNELSADEEHINYPEEDLNVENIASALSNGEFKPRAIFCVAHSLQLAVKDAIDHNEAVQMTLTTARQAVMVLRRPNWKNLLRSDLKKPIFDCPTRWTSTYHMLVRLQSFQSIFGEHRELSIYSEEFWTEIVDIIKCLKPLNEANVALQREELTISDFYIEWLNCRTKVEAIHTAFAGDLVKFMKKRENNLMEKDCILESLYLDGRINIMLSDQECVKAKSLLCQTFRQLDIIASSEAGPSEINIPCTSRDDENDTLIKSDLESMLQQTEKMRKLPQSVTENKFEESLNKLRLEPRLPLSKNIIAHWHGKDASAISLQKVASCVLAAPATQFSVERLFSSVKCMLHPLRTDIGGSLQQDIMFIRANHDLLE